MLARRVHEALVDELLCRGVPATAFADRDLVGAGRQGQDLGMHQRVVEHDVRAFQYFSGTQRKKVRGARSGTHQIDLAAYMLHGAMTPPSRPGRRDDAGGTAVTGA